MFDDLKKLKDKTKGLSPDTETIDLSLPKELDVEKISEDVRSTVENGVNQTTDMSKRTVGRVRGTFTSPKSETKRGLLKEETHFFCSDCNAKLGPMETKKWKNALKVLMGGAAAVAGVVLINPVLVFKGASSLTSLKKDDRGMMEKLKGDSKLREHARNYLVQCEYCGDWVCSRCYLAERVICNRCGSERGFMDGLLERSDEQ